MWSPARTSDRVGRVVLDHVEVAQHRVGGAAVPLRHAAARDVRLEQLHTAVVAVEVPRPAQPDVVVERARVVLGQDDDVIDIGVDAVRQREVDDPVLAAEGDGRLGPLLGQDRETLAFAAREDHCHRPFHGPSSLQDPWSGPCADPIAMLARAASANVNAMFAGRSRAPVRAGLQEQARIDEVAVEHDRPVEVGAGRMPGVALVADRPGPPSPGSPGGCCPGSRRSCGRTRSAARSCAR